MKRLRLRCGITTFRPSSGRDEESRHSLLRAGFVVLGLWMLLPTSASAQPPVPQVPEITESQWPGDAPCWNSRVSCHPTRAAITSTGPDTATGACSPISTGSDLRVSMAWAGRHPTRKASTRSGMARPARTPSILPASRGPDHCVSSRVWRIPGVRSACTIRWAPTSPFTISIRLRRDRAPFHSPSTSTGTMVVDVRLVPVFRVQFSVFSMAPSAVCC